MRKQHRQYKCSAFILTREMVVHLFWGRGSGGVLKSTEYTRNKNSIYLAENRLSVKRCGGHPKCKFLN